MKAAQDELRPGGIIVIMPGSTDEGVRLMKDMTVDTWKGSARIGRKVH